MSNITETFMDENNVRILVQVRKEGDDLKDNRILFTDRGGGSSQSGTERAKDWCDLIDKIRAAGSSSRFN